MSGQPNHPNHHSNQGKEFERHQTLYQKCPEVKRGAERRGARIGREAKVAYLRKKYQEEFPITEDDLSFVIALGWLEIDGKLYFQHPETGERLTRDHYITEGHRWLVDRFDPNIELLEELGLIGPPYIDSEPRERIIRRRFWNLTPSGRDLVDRAFTGENTGDTGENVVHRIGMHLCRWWCEERWDWAIEKDVIDVEPYSHADGSEMDLVVWNEGGYQTVDGEDVDKYPRHLFEVETGMSDWNDLEGDANKMAYLRGDSWWIFPTREVAVKVLDELTLRGYTGLDRPIPETLAMRNHRDTYTKRLQDSDPGLSHLNHPPVECVLTYKQLVDDLKDWRPELFYGPRDVDQ